MNFFGLAAAQLDEYKRLKTFLQSDNLSAPPMMLTGLSHIHKAHFLSALAAEDNIKLPLLALVESESEALRLVEDINTFSMSEIAAVYPAKDLNLGNTVAVSREYEHKRLDVLFRIIERQLAIVCATPEAVAQLTIGKSSLIGKTITINSTVTLQPTAFAERLIALGYSRADMVEGMGQFSVRGSIIDVYPVNLGYPVRIELWGDEIDTISAFDIESQRRIDTIKEVKIPPAIETLFDDMTTFADTLAELQKQIRGKHAPKAKSILAADIERINSGLQPHNIDKYLPLTDTADGLFEYLDRAIILENTRCREMFRSAHAQYQEDVAILFESGELFRGIDRHMLSRAEYTELEAKYTRAYFDTFLRGGDLKLSDLQNVQGGQLSPWSGEYKVLCEELRGYMRKGYAAAVFAGTDKYARALAKDLRDDGFPADFSEKPKKLYSGKIYVLEGTLTAGFDYSETLCVCITHTGANHIEKKSYSAAKPKKKKKGEEINSLSDISVGDYIVHGSYGIGIFEGVTKLTSDGISKDYIKLKYAGTDILYVPVTQLDLISRYIGNTDTANIKLNKLHSDQWKKAKTKAKAAAEELAEELIELYGKRMRSVGHAFTPDGQEQADFENHFSYVETEDQLRCINEIKRDMQDIRPMDRLLCGDVGFGKTEVALRAAFKCVMEGKQCALLCPTTVLAWQHYQTASKRMEGFHLNIELLSRFRTAKEIKQVLEKLQKGIVDLVIGTHRLVQDDVIFKNLGLVIIDEEQRFGVNHKEKFKENFTGVDILTLSATPIPRTLNMAMSGIRDMSVIETPPQDRQPVTTYVIEHDYGVIASAIEKELRRNGQVYYLHNRVESILSCAAKLSELCPTAAIGVAHGKMSEDEMMDVWRRLLDREIDVLVCTTIIETGVDVPNVNTLIIENADYMGLAQLHQLRGRVGRTNRRAFAYFTFQRGKVLSEIAEKRLNAIREYTQFGSGFRIAMRDLEIRGAGSILGQRQSGHLSAVGYDMYLQLLNEAVAEKKGEKPTPKEECLVDIKVDAYIPETYIKNQAQRVSCYKRIAEIQNDDDAFDVTDELIDRYGELPKSVHGLIEVVQVRNAASRSLITEIAQSGGVVHCYTKHPNMERVSEAIGALGNRITLSLTGRTGIDIRLEKNEDSLSAIKAFLDVYALK